MRWQPFMVDSDIQCTIDPKRNFVDYIDDYTYYTVIYLMTKKSELFTCFLRCYKT